MTWQKSVLASLGLLAHSRVPEYDEGHIWLGSLSLLLKARKYKVVEYFFIHYLVVLHI